MSGVCMSIKHSLVIRETAEINDLFLTPGSGTVSGADRIMRRHRILTMLPVSRCASCTDFAVLVSNKMFYSCFTESVLTLSASSRFELLSVKSGNRLRSIIKECSEISRATFERPETFNAGYLKEAQTILVDLGLTLFREFKLVPSD